MGWSNHRHGMAKGWSWGKFGVCVEYMVELANRLGADPWFSMPKADGLPTAKSEAEDFMDYWNLRKPLGHCVSLNMSHNSQQQLQQHIIWYTYLVMTNTSPWKIWKDPPFLIGEPSISMGHGSTMAIGPGHVGSSHGVRLSGSLCCCFCRSTRRDFDAVRGQVVMCLVRPSNWKQHIFPSFRD